MTTESFDLTKIPEASCLNKSGGTTELGFQLNRLCGGRSANVDKVTLNCGRMSIDVLPTRGMGIWQASHGKIRFGWDSPVAGPVHPSWVPISEPSGLGWLDGFDEMVVRCGLANNGAPEFDDNHQLVWPLHGRIANLPATDVVVAIDDTAGCISIRGTVHENRFHFQRLQLQTEIKLRLDSDEISIVDTVTNLSDRPASFQMLYHTNFGPPLLEQGSEFFAPIEKLVPRNAHAASGIENWNQYGAPEASYAEQVYFAELASDANDQTAVVLANADRSLAASLRYNTKSLPCFSLWKNTVSKADGYVTGLEPGTNFPNPRSFEESHNRVVNLDPQSSHTMTLDIGLLVDIDRVNESIKTVERLCGQASILNTPSPDWCAD